ETCDDLSERIRAWLDQAVATMDTAMGGFEFRTDTTNRVVPLTPEIVRAAMPIVRRVLARPVTALAESYLESHFKLDSIR
ncbi:hypothetical protein ABTD73_21540, partial [Acinetobacter baumannii]